MLLAKFFLPYLKMVSIFDHFSNKIFKTFVVLLLIDSEVMRRPKSVPLLKKRLILQIDFCVFRKFWYGFE